MVTYGEMIDSISKILPQPFTTQQLTEAIEKEYGKKRRIDLASLGTDIARARSSFSSLHLLPTVIVETFLKTRRS